MSEIIAAESGVGDVISLLWFKKRLPHYATRFIELVLLLTADHGPCVSGAHNTIGAFQLPFLLGLLTELVAARAGKDLVASVASGLLTVGPRFGGAIDDAARNYKRV